MDKKMNNVGLIGSLLLTLCAVPELIRTVKDGRCHIGWGFLLMWFFGEVLCLFYGLDLNEIPLLINYTFNTFVVSIMLWYKFKNKKFEETRA
jgi:uncharacterized protein with PQ loop repeat